MEYSWKWLLPSGFLYQQKPLISTCQQGNIFRPTGEAVANTTDFKSQSVSSMYVHILLLHIFPISNLHTPYSFSSPLPPSYFPPYPPLFSLLTLFGYSSLHKSPQTKNEQMEMEANPLSNVYIPLLRFLVYLTGKALRAEAHDNL